MDILFLMLFPACLLALLGHKLYRKGISKGIDQTFRKKDTVSVLFAYMIEQHRHVDKFSLRAGYKLIENEARIEILSDAVDIPDKLYKQNMLPSDIMHIIVFNITDRDLRVGRYHSAKGALSDEGIFINILWHHTLKTLCGRKLLDQGIYDSARASMAKAIASSG